MGPAAFNSSTPSIRTWSRPHFMTQMSDPVPAAEFLAMGRKRSVMNQALQALHVAAPNAVDVLALPDGARPLRAVQVNVKAAHSALPVSAPVQRGP